MATVIRLTRRGRKNSPFYRIVLVDKRRARDGKFIKVLGNYNPRNKKVEADREKIDFYVKHGAQLSTVVTRLLKN